MCPHCGYDLRQDEIIALVDVYFDPRDCGIIWKGEHVKLRPLGNAILHSLLKARGRVVSHEVLAERMGYEGDMPNRIISVEIHRLRKALVGAPIKNKNNQGYYWDLRA